MEKQSGHKNKYLDGLSHPDQNTIFILLKEVDDSARLRESDLHPISAKTPVPQYEPMHRKKRKGKIVDDYNRDRQLRLTKKHWPRS